MSWCLIGFHDWQYYTRTVIYKKDDVVVAEKEEVFKRICSKCGRIEKDVGKYGQWVRVIEDRKG